MSPRTGRPTDDKKVVRLQFRLSGGDVKKLEYAAEVLGLTKAEVVRRVIKQVYEEIQKKRGEIMLNAVSYGYVIKKMELLDGTIYTDVRTSSEQMEGFIGIDREDESPLYISKAAIKAIEFTGERW